MSLLARTTDFQPGKIIQSQPFDDEFDQLVDLLAGNSQNKSIRVISNDDDFAVARFDQRGANHIIEGYANGGEVFRLEKDGDIILARYVTGINADPTDNNHLARKIYVDSKKVSFNVGFSIVDPATANLNSREFGSWPIPGGGVVTITKTKVFYREGSHTAGGSLTFKVDRAFVGDISTLSLNDTNDDQAIVYEDNIGDITPVENEIFSCYMSARSGTITEKDVMVIIEGYRLTH